MKRRRHLIRLMMTATMVASLGAVLAWTRPVQNQAAPDDTKTNQGDSNRSATTADQQKESRSARQTTRRIRRAILGGKSLSTYAHNVKIITRNGIVTLKGPVRSEQEKDEIGRKAKEVAGGFTVKNELTVAPSR